MRVLSPQTIGPLFSFLSRHQPHPLCASSPILLKSSRPQQRRTSRASTTGGSTQLVRRMASSTDAAGNDAGTAKKKAPVIAQYIFLRRDLDWPAGAMAAQAAHASVAAITQGLAAHSEATASYVAPDNLPHMTKMVYGVDTQQELEQVREAWNTLIQSTTTGGEGTEGDCLHAYWWVEQPENIPTALATWPIVRTNKVSKVIKKLNLSYF